MSDLQYYCMYLVTDLLYGIGQPKCSWTPLACLRSWISHILDGEESTRLSRKEKERSKEERKKRSWISALRNSVQQNMHRPWLSTAHRPN